MAGPAGILVPLEHLFVILGPVRITHGMHAVVVTLDFRGQQLAAAVVEGLDLQKVPVADVVDAEWLRYRRKAGLGRYPG